jgi:hypothetical protein
MFDFCCLFPYLQLQKHSFEREFGNTQTVPTMSTLAGLLAYLHTPALLYFFCSVSRSQLTLASSGFSVSAAICLH